MIFFYVSFMIFFSLVCFVVRDHREKILTKWAFQRFCKKKIIILVSQQSQTGVNSITVNFIYNMNFGFSSF